MDPSLIILSVVSAVGGFAFIIFFIVMGYLCCSSPKDEIDYEDQQFRSNLMDNDELLGSIQDDFEQQEREYDEEPDLLLAQDKFSLKFNEIAEQKQPHQQVQQQIPEVIPEQKQQKQEENQEVLEQPAEEYEEQYYEEGDYDYQPEIEYEYTQEELQIANNTNRYLVMALYDYLEPEENQISFRAGELIWVGTDGSHPEEDWWWGQKKNSEEEGYFARDYVKVLPRKIKTSTKQDAKIAEIAAKLNMK